MNRPQKILLLGSGALKIGQAGEFDYSGSQAIKACKEAGAEVVLVNPNIATNQTSRNVADKVYFVPVDADFVTRIIEKEKPDAILLAWGGQTALNTGIELEKRGVLKKHNVQVLGTPVSVIETTEDREAFNAALDQIDVKYPRSIACRNEKEAWDAVKKITYPVIVRAAFALGGGGSGFAENDEEFTKIIHKAFSFSPQILVEESLKGWKEIEYEVVRDADGNKITVCNMENFDPLGIHTGESIVIAPSQTLNDHEYQKLRSIALKTIEHLGVVGECNIQYALDPKSDDYRVIEVNARLSRSSALASKATGYPLAFVAAQIALGKTLPEIKNAVTGKTSAMFEPSLDYVALKIPRWDLNKFRKVSDQIGSEMKSVGEIMALGRSFEEALQKGLRMLQIGAHGLAVHPFSFTADICSVLQKPTPRRIFAVYEALKSGISAEEISQMTGIDFWFLSKMERILQTERLLQTIAPQQLTDTSDDIIATLRRAKEDGFSDAEIEKIWNGSFSENDIRGFRKSLGILPVVKKIDTLAAEFPAETNYLFWTYHGEKHDITFQNTNAESPSEMHCKTLEKKLPSFFDPNVRNTKKGIELFLIHEQERQKQAENNRIAYVISADEIRESFPDYDPKHADDFQKDAFPLTEAAHQQALEKDTTGTIRWIAGGSGSGKSEVVLPELSVIPGIVIETTFSRYDFIRNEIEKALNAKKKVEIHAVFTPLEQCYHFCKQRSVRQVSDEQFIRTHWNFRKNIYQIAKEFYGNEKVEIICYRNNVFVAEKSTRIMVDNILAALQKSCHTEEEVKKVIYEYNTNASIGREIAQAAESEQKDKDGKFGQRFSEVSGNGKANGQYQLAQDNGAKQITSHTPQKVLVLGSGPYSIGSSVEFDWCCVNAVQTLRKKGIETIMLNSNPETVSTDYETGDYLFFDELSLERTLDVLDIMQPSGTVLFSGGQIPNNLAPRLGELQIPILGTHPDNIDQAESRHLFSSLCDELDIDQPEWQEFATLADAEDFSEKVGYPVLVRPSKVLSGAAMAVARDRDELEDFLGKASKIDSDAPVVVSKFEVGAREIEIDAVAHKGELILHAISEHVENAGVHSGDATVVFPPQKTYLETIRRIKLIAKKLAKALSITGPFNIQFLAKNNAIKVIELNLRASRSFPFVSKISGINFIEVATNAALGEVESPDERRKKYRTLEMDHVGVKCPQFSFSRLSGADPVLSVEMASTGEVGCFGRSFEEAFLKSMISVGFQIPKKGVLFSAGDTKSKLDLLPVAQFFAKKNLHIFATPGTADFFAENGVIAQKLEKISASGNESMLGLIRSREIDLVINIPKNYAHEEVTDGYRIRRAAVDANVALVTNTQVARAIALALEEFPTIESLPVLSEKEYF